MAGVKKIKGRKIIKDESIKALEDNVMVSVPVKEKKKGSNFVKKKIKTRKIRMFLTNAEEKKMDAAIEREDNMSIAVMIFILLVCFVVGISLGYLLYRIAINGVL